MSTRDGETNLGAAKLDSGMRHGEIDPQARPVPIMANAKDELQAVRGIAALVVLLHHTSFFFVTSVAFHRSSVILLNAHAAVVTFFVLSGFVLTRSLSKTSVTPRQAVRFYIQRLFRIYPGLWSGLILLALYELSGLRHVVSGEFSTWFITLGDKQLTTKRVIMTMIGMNNQLMAPLWSIKVEIAMSFLMPILVFIAQKSKNTLIAALFIGLFISIIMPQYTILRHLWSFCLGVTLAQNMTRADWRISPLLNRMIAMMALLVLILFRSIEPAWAIDLDYDAVLPNIVEAMAAFLLLNCIVMGAEDFAFLRLRTLDQLGNISYSLYLLHWSVMLLIGKSIAVSGLFSSAMDARAAFLMVTTFAITTALSMLSYRYIELPGIAAGKQLLLSWRETCRQPVG